MTGELERCLLEVRAMMLRLDGRTLVLVNYHVPELQAGSA